MSQIPTGPVASTSHLDAEPAPTNELSGLVSPHGSATAEATSSAWSAIGDATDASEVESSSQPGSSTDIPSTPSGYTSSPAATIVQVDSVAASITVSELPSPATMANPNLATPGSSAVQSQFVAAVEPAHAPSPLGLSPSVKLAGLNNELEFPGLDFSNGLSPEELKAFSDTSPIGAQPSAANGQMPLLPCQVPQVSAMLQQLPPHLSQQDYQNVQATFRRLPARSQQPNSGAVPYWIPQRGQQAPLHMLYRQIVQMQHFGQEYLRLHPMSQSLPPMAMPEPMQMWQPPVQLWSIPETAAAADAASVGHQCRLATYP